MGRCGIHMSQDRPAPPEPVPGRRPTSASRSRVKCGQMVVVDRDGAGKNLPPWAHLGQTGEASPGLDTLPANP